MSRRAGSPASHRPPEDPGIAALATAPSDYAELKRRITAAGLINKRAGHYVLRISANSLALIGLFAILVAFPKPPVAIATAIGLALVSGQLGFQLHDAGHRQMFASGRLNEAVGLVTANLLLGMSCGWWVDKHNRHHGNPNHVDLDPDIKVGTVSYSIAQALAKRGLARRIAAHQAYYFFPLLFGLAWAMHGAGIRHLVAKRDRGAAIEGAGLLIHFAAYLALLVVTVGPWWAIAVAVIHRSLAGFYMALVFAPNHKGMPQLAGRERLDFLRSQVLTARNVRAHPFTDFLYGGLNYQIEHHLFPTMPRCNLRAAHEIVRGFCGELDVAYHETSIVQSYREILGFLHEVGAPLRAAGAAAN